MNLDLKRVRNGALSLAAVASLALAPAALASGGGANSGGVNSGGVNSGGGGGATAPAPAPAPAPSGGTISPTTGTTPTGSCATIGNFGNTTGYYSIWAAIWTNWGVTNDCDTPVNWRMDYVNNSTGAVDFSSYGALDPGSNGGTVDEDWAAFLTPYTVKLSVSDDSGNEIDNRSAVVTTKSQAAPVAPTGGGSNSNRPTRPRA
jgi:hypothetical protein